LIDAMRCGMMIVGDASISARRPRSPAFVIGQRHFGTRFGPPPPRAVGE
jgi:hypothetical protein